MIGQTVGHYRIIAKIGAGGMGEVFRAEDIRLDRDAAVKFLPAELARDPDRRARFLREAKAASALNHPHVCVVYDVGETADGIPYIAMEYVEGDALDALVRRGQLPIDTIIEMAMQVADALDAAHANRIIHRDIKLANIKLKARGQVKVLDFGLAKRLSPVGRESEDATCELKQTQSGQVLGTPSYMSPEQALGREVDHRTDIFSLGVVLYELTTGELPFVGTSFSEVVDQIVHGQPQAIARLNYNVTPEFERIILKCLHKSPDRRYQSARELLIDLRNLGQSLEKDAHSVVPRRRGSIVADASRTGSSSPIDDAHTMDLASPELKDSDIFISCAELDDQPLAPGREGWISQFQRNLKVRLEQLFGDRVKVASHPMPPGQAEVDEQLCENLPRVKTMVSVVSPPFIKSEGCRRDVEQFWDRTQQTGNFWVESKPRLFKVVKTPVNDRDLPPRLEQLFGQLMGFEFYERDSESGRLREFDEAFGEESRQRYYERIYDLAYEIAQVLRYQRSASQGDMIARSGKKIFLAETTSDLQPARDRLQRELLEQGHTVLPDRPLPLNADQLRTAIRSYLEQCDLAVHLVGQRYGLVPEDADRSVVALQNQIAAVQSATTGLERLIWMPKNLQMIDERQAAFVRQVMQDPEVHRGADVIEDTLENLKEILEQKCRPKLPIASATPPAVSPGTAVPRVYLICDREDEVAIEPLEDYFYSQGIEVSLPDFDQDESTISQIHRQNLEDCDAALIYYGAGSKSWVDIKLRDLLKAIGYRSGRPIEHQAVYIAPPVDRRKERFKTLSADVLVSIGESFDPALLASFIHRVKEKRSATA